MSDKQKIIALTAIIKNVILSLNQWHLAMPHVGFDKMSIVLQKGLTLVEAA